MTPHLSTDAVVAFRERRLAPDEFLAADRHVATCTACASAVSAVPVPAAIAFDDADRDDPHLDYDMLEALVDGRATNLDREVADAHLDGCTACASALADLEAFRDTIAVSTRNTPSLRPRREPAWHRYVLPAAAAAVLALALVVPRLPRPPADAPPSHGRDPDPAVAPSTPSTSTEVSSPAVVAPAPTPGSKAVPAPPSAPSDLDEPRRSGTRELDGKRFRFVAGEWIDESYDRRARLPEVRVTTADERLAIETRVPQLARFASLGPRARIVVDDTVYVFDIRD